MTSPTTGNFVWASDGYKPELRPAIVIAVLPNDTFIVAFGYGNPYPEHVRVDHFKTPGRAAGLTKPTHFRGGVVVRKKDIARISGRCPMKIVLELQQMFEKRYRQLTALHQPAVVEPPTPKQPVSSPSSADQESALPVLSMSPPSTESS